MVSTSPLQDGGNLRFSLNDKRLASFWPQELSTGYVKVNIFVN